ncbi:MAG: hypothetical protein GF400_02045 [Candidatus Eisenbacteria bacterium]|nr:hypothetical protein [Candidatus Eisenbacteria bacterium]
MGLASPYHNWCARITLRARGFPAQARSQKQGDEMAHESGESARDVKIEKSLDMTGLFCPEPVVRTNEAIQELDEGSVLEMLADDPSSKSDMESWARRSGHELLSVEENDGTFRFLIRRLR